MIISDKIFRKIVSVFDKEFKIKQKFLYGTTCMRERVHRDIGKLSPRVFLHKGEQNEQPAGWHSRSNILARIDICVQNVRKSNGQSTK